MEKRVVVFRKDLLPLSETFILDQFRSYSSWKPYLTGYQLCQGLDVTGVPAFTLEEGISRFLKLAYLKLFQHGQYIGIVPPAFRRFVEQTGAKLIHAHFGYDAILVYDLAKALNMPLVVTLHGSDILHSPEVWKSGREGFFFRCYPDKLQRLFKDERVFFIVVSKALRDAAIQLGVPKDRCTVCYTGSDPAYFSPSAHDVAGSKRVLFVGRLVAIKGCEFLLEAMSTVQKQIPGAELVVVGDGPEKRRLVEIAEALELNAVFLGALPRGQVREWMDKSRVFCAPSISEPPGSFETFGMVILEAQLCGLPVITSAKGGSESIIHNETGFVFAEKDSKSLAQYLCLLLSDVELRNRFSDRARKHVLANFSLETCTRRVEDYYDEIVASLGAQVAQTPW